MCIFDVTPRPSTAFSVTPAGVQIRPYYKRRNLDSRLRGNDRKRLISAFFTKLIFPLYK